MLWIPTLVSRVCLTPSQKSAAIQMRKAMSHDNETLEIMPD